MRMRERGVNRHQLALCLTHSFNRFIAGLVELSVDNSLLRLPKDHSVRHRNMSFVRGTQVEARYQGKPEWYAAVVTKVYHTSCDVVYTGDELLQEGTDVFVKTEGSKHHARAKIVGRYLEV